MTQQFQASAALTAMTRWTVPFSWEGILLPWVTFVIEFIM